MKIAIKRVYEPYEESDGYRVLVDRLWPRGLTKARVHYDEWAKFLAPSTELRKAFGHDPSHWATFQEKYVAELDANPEALKFAKKLSSPEMAKCPRRKRERGRRPSEVAPRARIRKSESDFRTLPGNISDIFSSEF